MKLTKNIILFSFFLFGTPYSILQAIENRASAVCTHYKPKFIEKPILDENGTEIGTTPLIDIGNGSHIAAGENWDSQSLASTDKRNTFEFDIKTSRLYRCNQIMNEAVHGSRLQKQCEERGFAHGMITNGSKECFISW